MTNKHRFVVNSRGEVVDLKHKPKPTPKQAVPDDLKTFNRDFDAIFGKGRHHEQRV